MTADSGKTTRKWYGEIRNGKEIWVYRDLRTNFIEIFDALRRGEIPETEMIREKSEPSLHDLLTEYGRKRIKDEFTEDRLLIKFYSLYEEITEIINLYLEKIDSFGILTGVEYREDDPCLYFRSMAGVSHTDPSISMVAKSASIGVSMCSFRTDLFQFTSEMAEKIMPNTVDLIGGSLALELLWRSGGLRNMVKFPASTFQVLGAEKAFFKHMRTGTPSPKHGFLFKYPGISSLPPSKRGKIARTVANKLAIAVRADFYGTRIDTETMKNLITKRIQEAKSR